MHVGLYIRALVYLVVLASMHDHESSGIEEGKQVCHELLVGHVFVVRDSARGNTTDNLAVDED